MFLRQEKTLIADEKLEFKSHRKDESEILKFKI